MNQIEEISAIQIGQRIKDFARFKYKTQRNLARVMGNPPQSLQMYIMGERKPGLIMLRRLYEAGCNLNWLVSGDERFNYYI